MVKEREDSIVPVWFRLDIQILTSINVSVGMNTVSVRIVIVCKPDLHQVSAYDEMIRRKVNVAIMPYLIIYSHFLAVDYER